MTSRPAWQQDRSIARKFPLTEVAAAHEAVESGQIVEMIIES